MDLPEGPVGAKDEKLSTEDRRQREWAEQVVRPGQAAFRRKLKAAYNAHCAVTGCGVGYLLDAAHITPYRGAQSDEGDCCTDR